MKTTYEAWLATDDQGQEITLGTAEGIQDLKRKGLIGPMARLLHRIAADTYEEASAVHHIKMGWGPYKPLGEPKDCPKGCGTKFYPEGSGECPNCGMIG